MSMSCHKMNYFSVPNNTHTHTHTHTHTQTHTHTSLTDFSFFFEKKSEKWGSNFQMKYVNSGYSSYTHLYALFVHSMHVGFLWSYAIWIKLGK